MAEKFIMIEESLNRIEGYDVKTRLEFTKPKTETSIREIPIPDEVVQALKAQKVQQARYKLFFGRAYQDNDLVFAMPDGKPMEPRNILKRLKNILNRAGLREEIRLHTIRHTFGTMLAQAGENPANIQKLTGHADVKTTLQTYCHSTMDDKRRAVDRLAGQLRGEKQGPQGPSSRG